MSMIPACGRLEEVELEQQEVQCSIQALLSLPLAPSITHTSSDSPPLHNRVPHPASGRLGNLQVQFQQFPPPPAPTSHPGCHETHSCTAYKGSIVSKVRSSFGGGYFLTGGWVCFIWRRRDESLHSSQETTCGKDQCGHRYFRLRSNKSIVS